MRFSPSLALTLALTPSFVLAAQTPTTLGGFLGLLTGIINLIIPLIFALVFLTISWGVIKAWIMKDPSADNVEQGKKIAFVGIIALTLMSAIWGIVRILSNSFFGN
jgi:hypothetical protein